MRPSELYNLSDITRAFDQTIVARGRELIAQVSALAVHDTVITARVQGSARKPYSVEIYVRDKTARKFSTHCTCPMVGGCKHCVAVLLKLLESQRAAPGVSQAVIAWLEGLREQAQIRTTVPTKTAPRTSNPTQLFYLLEPSERRGSVGVHMIKGNLDRNGLPRDSCKPWSNIETALVKTSQFVSEEDLPILRLLWATRERQYYGGDWLSLRGAAGDDILRRLIATGRCYADLTTRLAQGAPRPGRIEWLPDAYGRMIVDIAVDGANGLITETEPCWYIDLDAEVAGSVELDVPRALLRQLLDAPPLTEDELPVVATALAEIVPSVPRPSTDAVAGIRLIDAPLRPVLRLDTLRALAVYGYRRYPYLHQAQDFDYAVASFRYGEAEFTLDDHREFITLADGETVRVRHDAAAEKRAIEALRAAGFASVPNYTLTVAHNPRPEGMLGLERPEDWPSFMDGGRHTLEQGGWTLEFGPLFRHHVLTVDSWEAEINQTEHGWLDLDMGIVVEGRRLSLAPLLANLFKRDPRWLDNAQAERIDGSESVDLIAPDGSRIRVKAERIKPLALTLIDLFDGFSDGPLRLSQLDAPRLADLTDMQRWQFRGADAVRELAERLRAAGAVQPVAPPAGLGLELRAYQREGLSWLQYLREHGIAGILADDMGLGKTAQTLAHLLLEKESGRLVRPALIVLPTSLIFNWQREAARFAPALRVLSLQGVARKERFDDIPHHDVVLTTYPLLWRDVEALVKHPYHLLILDEAQMVKNAKSHAAEAVRKLDARHRLCLTGTPLENHLGELWTLFDFLLPGFLGSQRDFARLWRTPIEKHGDQGRRDLLARRVQPFILRRRKEAVAKELPPKTVIVRTVELEGGQRDLYETVRAAVDAKVREEISSKGFNRSQIVILDALLKLRQVCCDPRLLKARGGDKVAERAKLELLMDMVPELVEEGRRILVFSSFTSMLDLIERELIKAKIPFVTLTGDTRDRETVVRRFQDGEVPVFLISLKAGGVGLNLTAADAVIHYDPWWNPAAENQATDRAHRIGQDKPVFVYKLIVAGSIEERMLALQEKKSALAEGLLGGGDQGVKFGESDLTALLAPLPQPK